MAQIKSYLSIQSIGSQIQYQTQHKKDINQLTTNPSLAYSQTIGHLDNRKFNTQQTFFKSSYIKNEPTYINLHSNLRQQQIQNNLSQMTLSPVITQQEINQLLMNQRIINFKVFEAKDQKVFIQIKENYISKLIQMRNDLEQRIKEGNNRYVRKKEKLAIKISNNQKLERQRKQRAISQIKEIKIQIEQMRRNFSLKKIQQRNPNHKKTERSRKHSNEKDRKKVKIYVPYYGMQTLQDPIYYQHNQRVKQIHYPYPPHPASVRQNSKYHFVSSQYHQHFHQVPQTPSKINHGGLISQFPVKSHSKHQKSMKSEPYQNAPYSAMKNSLVSMKVNPSSLGKSANLFEIIGQKLIQQVNSPKMRQSNYERPTRKQSMASNDSKSNSVTQQIKHALNYQINDLAIGAGGISPVYTQPNNAFPPSNSHYAMPMTSSKRYNEHDHEININVKNANHNTDQKFSYFDNFDQEDVNTLKRSMGSKNVNQQMRTSNPRITADRWSKKDDVEQDKEIVSLIRQSTNSLKLTKDKAHQKQKRNNKPQQKQRRYSDHIKLIDTNHNAEDEFNMTEKQKQHNESAVIVEFNDEDTFNRNSLSYNESNKNHNRKQSSKSNKKNENNSDFDFSLDQNSNKNHKDKKDDQVKKKKHSQNMKTIQAKDNLLNIPSSNHSHNNSEINVIIDHNDSSDSPNKHSLSKNSSRSNNAQKNPILQSNVNILFEDHQSQSKSYRLSLNQESTPTNKSSNNIPFLNQLSPRNSRPNRSSVPPLELYKINKQAMEKIQQVTSRIQVTNGPDINTYANEKSVQSRYTQTQRDGLMSYSAETSKDEFFVSQSLKTSQLGPHPPLNKPPSLTEIQKEEQEQDEDDVMASIKLNTDSRMSRDSKKQRHFAQLVQDNEQFDDSDELDGINLIAQSRISRHRNSVQSRQKFQEKLLQKPTMTQSQLNNKDHLDMQGEDSELRKSTQSSIIKKGSAIHKSTQRHTQLRQSKHLEKSSMRHSPELANAPIEQVEEQQQTVSVINPKKGHQRQGSLQ